MGIGAGGGGRHLRRRHGHRRRARRVSDRDARRRACATRAWTPGRWGNGPGDRYAPHEHDYDKVLVCAAGLDPVRAAGPRQRPSTSTPGDRLDLPAGTRHDAVVGPGWRHVPRGARAGRHVRRARVAAPGRELVSGPCLRAAMPIAARPLARADERVGGDRRRHHDRLAGGERLRPAVAVEPERAAERGHDLRRPPGRPSLDSPWWSRQLQPELRDRRARRRRSGTRRRAARRCAVGVGARAATRRCGASGRRAAPVGDPEGQVGRLLELVDEGPAADRVERPGPDEQHVAGARRDRAAVRRARRRPSAIAARSAASDRPSAGPVISCRARRRVEDDPRLGLADGPRPRRARGRARRRDGPGATASRPASMSLASSGNRAPVAREARGARPARRRPRPPARPACVGAIGPTWHDRCRARQPQLADAVAWARRVGYPPTAGRWVPGPAGGAARGRATVVGSSSWSGRLHCRVRDAARRGHTNAPAGAGASVGVGCGRLAAAERAHRNGLSMGSLGRAASRSVLITMLMIENSARSPSTVANTMSCAPSLPRSAATRRDTAATDAARLPKK